MHFWKNVFNSVMRCGPSPSISRFSLTYCMFSTVRRELKGENHDCSSEKPVIKKKVSRLNHSDASLSKLMLKLKSKKLRQKSNLIYFEGKRLLNDAIHAGIVPLYIYFSRTDDIRDLQIPTETELFKVPYEDLKLWSDLTTCPGILVICERPEVVVDYKPLVPVSVLCDNVREPGNLGSIIRNAAGAGVKNVYLSKGCVDLWDPKVIRGSMGAQFRIPVLTDVLLQDLQKSLNPETLFLVATNDAKSGEAIPYYSIEYPHFDNITLVIGGETEGISDNSLELAKSFHFRKITIPLSNLVESLNNVSAFSIILYEIKRQLELAKLRS